MESRTVGVLGGGQLGRMMAESASKLGVRIAILDPGGSSSPAGQLTQLCIEGSYQDSSKVLDLSSVSDIITVEIEHVNVDILSQLEQKGHIVRPSAKTIRTIQDKYIQKEFLKAFGISLPHYMLITDAQSIQMAGERFGYPFMLKNRKLAYDGRGNCVVKSPDEVLSAFHKLGEVDLYAEKLIPFVKEIAVMVVRTIDGQVLPYPVVETVQKDNICHIVTAPAQIGILPTETALKLATDAVKCFDGVGIFGVEMFLLNDDSILLNEIAPRPHNSGHYTIEACEIDQFEMHLRAVLGLPCPTPRMKVANAMMINILGGDSMEDTVSLLKKSLSVPGASIHWYGKAESRKGRKMAHVTVTGDSISHLRERVESLGITREIHGLPPNLLPRVGIIMGSDSDLPTMKDAAEILDNFRIPYELTIVSAHRTPTRLYTYSQTAVERGLQVIIAGAGGAAHLPGMVAALTSLPVIGVPIKTSTLNGQDSLLSIVQMPKGVPVATVAIGNAANAGLLAVRIMASTASSGGNGLSGLNSNNKELINQMDAFMLKQEEDVLRKAEMLEAVGYSKYLDKVYDK